MPGRIETKVKEKKKKVSSPRASPHSLGGGEVIVQCTSGVRRKAGYKWLM